MAVPDPNKDMLLNNILLVSWQNIGKIFDDDISEGFTGDVDRFYQRVILGI